VKIEIRFSEDVAIVTLSGKFLAGGDGPFLRQKVKDLIEAGTKMLVVDLGEVPSIDSTGLGFLAGSRVTAQNAGVYLVLSAVRPHVKRVLDQVKLGEFFILADDEAAAVQKVKELSQSPAGSKTDPAKEPKGRKQSPSPTQ
jgi:anti-sigma B factor antagonist